MLTLSGHGRTRGCIIEYRGVVVGGKAVGWARLRGPSLCEPDFWQVKAIGSNEWTGEHKTLAEAEAALATEGG